MKRIVVIIMLLVGIVAAIAGWCLFAPATAFSPKSYALLIPTGSSYADLMQQLNKKELILHPAQFNLMAKQLNYPEKIKAGRYLIEKGSNLITIIRKLRNGQQNPVNLVITKLRTREDFAALAAKKFEFDAASFQAYLNSNDSLRRFNLDTNTIMAGVMPDTYTYFWNTTPARVMEKIIGNSEQFWTADRKKLALEKGLTPVEVVTLASIIDEESNKLEDKGKIASVYLNRMQKGMRLGADPTVKFALHNFALKRIYNKHLAVESPYNTYRVAGLPPGPICTPQKETIDAVLHAPATDYLYFVAKADFSGYHVFAATYEEHLSFAKAYQQALDNYMKTKQSESGDTTKP
jgi:UPF0755 protein